MARHVKKPYSIDDFLGVIKQDIDEAIDFLTAEFNDAFEQADRYFNGEVDIPVEAGRSAVVSTTVRDSIRNMRPSIMRVLASNRKRLVQYIPSNIQTAPVVEQQEVYVHQLFWKNNGYMVLYEAIDESLKHRFGPVKTYWDEDPTPEFARLTMMTLDEVQFLSEMDDVDILSIEPSTVPSEGETDSDFYDVECLREASNGQIIMEAVPYGEFFISRNARSTRDARVHGHRRSVTVAEAVEMGLEYDDWWDLDDDDPETAKVSGQKTTAKGYRKETETDRGDVLSHRFLLTECYVKLDLENVGYDQLYCLYLGGSSYELLAYEREGESPFDIICHDIKAFSPIGGSVPDITIPTQDVMTSLLRGMLDNVHLANTPRLGGNPSQVNFDDLMNFEIGHPIRFKGSGTTVQVVEVASQIQSTLPMLQWMEQDSQNKIGVTKAAQGLDPNAMQSTDKQAVQNTIQMSQGQVELSVRNIIETGIVNIFKKLLKLSVQHLDRIQIVKMRGMLIPVDQLLFDSDCYAQPQVGLGTVSDEQRIAGLMATIQQQQQIMTTMGVANPFVTATHMYNALEDLTEMFGLYDVSRYYSLVTPEVEKQFAAQRQQEAAAAEQAGKGKDPAQALIEVEGIKANTEKLKAISAARSKALELQLKAIEYDASNDLERDKMAQDRQLKAAELIASTGAIVDQNDIKREQNEQRVSPTEGKIAAATDAAE